MLPHKPTKWPEEPSLARRPSPTSPSSQHRLGDNTGSSVRQPLLLLTDEPHRNQTDANRHLLERVTRIEYPSEMPPAVRLQNGQGAVTAEDQKLEGLEAVPVFRMILYAMFLETAVDTSGILAMEARDRCVYVL